MSGGGHDKASQQDHDLIGFGSQFNTHWYDHAPFPLTTISASSDPVKNR